MVDILPEDAPAPRLCHLIKWPDFDGYGFNLHAERSNPGQFIGKIDDDSPAQLAGLREGDRIIEVNGVNINNENHRQVVERIKANPNEAKLLLVDFETDQWYRETDFVIKSSQLNVIYIKTPVPRPEPDSPRAQFHQGHFAKLGQQHINETGAKLANLGQQANNGQKVPETSGQVYESSLDTSNTQSLNTSDFNDDSIEQQKQQQQQQQQDRVSPPMSPDSGRGDEELAQFKAPPVGPEVLTVEAEINHQSLEQHARKQQVLAEVKRQFAKRNLINDDDDSGEHEQQEENNQEQNNNNNNNNNGKQQQLVSSKKETIFDDKEHARQVHNRSADSGKSSAAPDATSHGSGGCDDNDHHDQGQPATVSPGLSQGQGQRELACDELKAASLSLSCTDSLESARGSLSTPPPPLPPPPPPTTTTTTSKHEQVVGGRLDGGISAGGHEDVASIQNTQANSNEIESIIESKRVLQANDEDKEDDAREDKTTTTTNTTTTTHDYNNQTDLLAKTKTPSLTTQARVQQNLITSNNNNQEEDEDVEEKEEGEQQYQLESLSKKRVVDTNNRQQPAEITRVNHTNSLHETSEQASAPAAVANPTEATTMTKIMAQQTATGDQQHTQKSHNVQPTAPATSTQQPNNVGPNGLLNMTVSQMRELIASRKKYDAKKAQMNIRQKYEIIQQL